MAIILNSLDFDNLMAEIEDTVQKILPDWDFADPNDLGRVVTEIATALAVKNNYIANRWANEAFITTGTDPYNIYLLAAYKAYIARTAQSSLVKVLATLTNPAVSSINIEPYSLQVTNSGEQPTKKFYENRDLIVFAPGDTSKEAVFISGQSKVATFTSDGLDFSSYEIIDTPVILNIGDGFDANYGIVVTTTAGTWKLVYDFVFSQPSDRHFMITPTNYGTVKITFGDNQKGAKPAIGETITVDYRIGGGSATIEAFAIDAVTISPVISGNSITSVENQNAEYSGADAEDPAYTGRIAPALGNSRSKIYDDDILASYIIGLPGVARAKVQFLSNIINIVVVPQGLGILGPDSLALVRQAISDKLAFGYNFQISNPIYKELTIRLNVSTTSAFRKVDVYRSTLQFVNNFLDPLYKNPVTKEYVNSFGGSFDVADFGFRLKKIESIYDYELVDPAGSVSLNPTEILTDAHTRPKLSITTANGVFTFRSGVFTSLGSVIKIAVVYSGTTTSSALVSNMPTSLVYTLSIGSDTGQDTFSFLSNYVNNDPILIKAAGYTFGDGTIVPDDSRLLLTSFTESGSGTGSNANPTPDMVTAEAFLDSTDCTFLDINVIGGI